MARLWAWAIRGRSHVAPLLEKAYIPGALPLTLGSLGLVLLYLLLVSFL